jgi:histidinol-phosphatase (PHP family)
MHLTINSDAHHPDEIANNFDDVASLLQDIGYRNIYIFNEGKWSAVKL